METQFLPQNVAFSIQFLLQDVAFSIVEKLDGDQLRAVNYVDLAGIVVTRSPFKHCRGWGDSMFVDSR